MGHRTSGLAIALALSLAGSAGAFHFDVLEWSAEWAGFADDFEDGILPDGDPGEAPIYFPICAVTDASETGGALVLAGPDEACPGNPGAVLATTGGTTSGELRATFRFVVPELGQSYGVTLSDAGATDLVSLVMTRTAIAGLFPDALLVVLVADPFTNGSPTPVKFLLLSTEPPHASVSAAAVELKLTTAPATGGILPDGAYRLCATTPCESETVTPFQSLVPVPPPAADGGALRPELGHGPALAAFSFGAGEFRFEVEEWSARGSASDDFEAASFGAVHPYSFLCGDEANAEQAGGALSLLGPAPGCGGAGVGFFAAHPGPVLARAAYDFAVPGRCESYGVSAGSTSGDDFALLSLARSEDPLDPDGGTDALYVSLVAEPEGDDRLQPVIAQARVSGDPEGDPALADVTSIELELELAADLAVLLPTGRFRLCTAAGCPASFTPLEPGAAATDPEATICGLPAASYDPPADGVGAIGWQGPIGASLFATQLPEPPGAWASAAAALALAGLVRKGQTVAS